MPRLFSYGTFQQEDIQLTTFGRRLTGVSDALVGFSQSMAAIDDPEVVRTSGKTHHCACRRIRGVAASVRVNAPLASGLEAWVYVDARGKPPS
jgi:hypothetical protein